MIPYWEHTPLSKMSLEQWEALCDRCGLCCLQKVIFEETEEVRYTNVACRLLDLETCRCTAYHCRAVEQPDCTSITLGHLNYPELMPTTCAYMRVYQGLPLPAWHPLLGGEGPLKAGVSLVGQMLPAEQAEGHDLADFLLPEDQAPNLEP